MKNLYLILLIVVIVGIVAIFALTFLNAGNQNLTGAGIWGGGYTCKNYDTEQCPYAPRTENECVSGCMGEWVKTEEMM